MDFPQKAVCSGYLFYFKKSTFVPYLLLLSCLSDIKTTSSKMELHRPPTPYVIPEKSEGHPNKKHPQLRERLSYRKKDWNQVTDRVVCRLKKESLWIIVYGCQS